MMFLSLHTAVIYIRFDDASLSFRLLSPLRAAALLNICFADAICFLDIAALILLLMATMPPLSLIFAIIDFHAAACCHY